MQSFERFLLAATLVAGVGVVLLVPISAMAAPWGTHDVFPGPNCSGQAGPTYTIVVNGLRADSSPNDAQFDGQSTSVRPVNPDGSFEPVWGHSLSDENGFSFIPVTLTYNISAAQKMDERTVTLDVRIFEGPTAEGAVVEQTTVRRRLSCNVSPNIPAFSEDPCPNGGTPHLFLFHDYNGNGTIEYGEAACRDLISGEYISYIEPITDPYGTGFSINREPSNFHAVEPYRLVDTRQPGSPQPTLSGATYIDVPVIGGRVPAGASSVYLNITAAGAARPGYVSVFPTATLRPNTSSLNLEFAGQDIPNLVNVPVGQDGKVRIYSSNGTDVIVDVVGYFLPSATGTASGGRYEPVPISRIYDSRNPGNSAVSGGTTVEIPVSQVCDPGLYDSVALNVTAADATDNGYLVLFAGPDVPDSSNVNFRTGVATANAAISSLSPTGTVKVHAVVSGTVNVILDVAGCFTNERAPTSSTGMFRSVTPARLLDTRSGSPLQAGTARFVQVEGTVGFDFPVSAIVGNVTGTQASGNGFITADGVGQSNATSILNLVNGQTKPNGGIIPLSNDGDADGIYLRATDVTTHLIFDATGGFVAP
jgi:hypothetical protein